MSTNRTHLEALKPSECDSLKKLRIHHDIEDWIQRIEPVDTRDYIAEYAVMLNSDPEMLLEPIAKSIETPIDWIRFDKINLESPTSLDWRIYILAHCPQENFHGTFEQAMRYGRQKQSKRFMRDTELMFAHPGTTDTHIVMSRKPRTEQIVLNAYLVREYAPRPATPFVETSRSLDDAIALLNNASRKNTPVERFTKMMLIPHYESIVAPREHLNILASMYEQRVITHT